MKFYAIGTPVIIAFFLYSCGMNPEKSVSGVSLRSQFLASNHGKYSSASGHHLTIEPDGSVVRGKTTRHWLYFSGKKNDLYLRINSVSNSDVSYSELGSRVNLDQVGFEEVKKALAYVNSPNSIPKKQGPEAVYARINFECFFGVNGQLEEFTTVPEHRKGLKYLWKIEPYMNLGAKFLAEFTMDTSHLIREKEVVSETGPLADLIPDSFVTEQMEKICNDQTAPFPNDSDFTYSLGVTSYTNERIEIVTQRPGLNEKPSAINKIDQRFFIREGSDTKIDIKSLAWPDLKGSFVTPKGKHDASGRFISWEPESPREEITLSPEHHSLRWYRDSSSDAMTCGFDFNLEITELFIQPNPHLPAGFFEAKYRSKDWKMIPPKNSNKNPRDCADENIIERINTLPPTGEDEPPVDLFIKFSNKSDEGVSIEFRDHQTGKLMISATRELPWSSEKSQFVFNEENSKK